MSRYAPRPNFVPAAEYVSLRRLTLNGRSYEPGDQIMKGEIHVRRLRQLYEARQIEMAQGVTIDLTGLAEMAAFIVPRILAPHEFLEDMAAEEGVRAEIQARFDTLSDEERELLRTMVAAEVEPKVDASLGVAASHPAQEGAVGAGGVSLPVELDPATGEPLPPVSDEEREAPGFGNEKGEPSPDGSPSDSDPSGAAPEGTAASAPAPRVVKVGMGGWQVVNSEGAPIGSGHRTRKAAEAALQQLVAGE